MERIKNWFNGLNKVYKILLVIFFDGFFGGVVRICGKKTTSKVIGILQFVLFITSLIGIGWFPSWSWILGIFYGIILVIDLLTVIIDNRISLFVD